MKTFTILLVAMLAIAGSAYAQSDTSATAAAQGTYPDGTTFGGVAINALQIASASIIAADGTADGQITVSLIGPPNPLGVQQKVTIEVDVSGGTKTAANVATIRGTCSIDMGNGTPVISGVPFVATITTTADHLGTVGLTIGTTSLPNGTINDGTMTITDLTL